MRLAIEQSLSFYHLSSNSVYLATNFPFQLFMTKTISASMFLLAGLFFSTCLQAQCIAVDLQCEYLVNRGLVDREWRYYPVRKLGYQGGQGYFPEPHDVW
jgi:hypothetical protein